MKFEFTKKDLIETKMGYSIFVSNEGYYTNGVIIASSKVAKLSTELLNYFQIKEEPTCIEVKVVKKVVQDPCFPRSLARFLPEGSNAIDCLGLVSYPDEGNCVIFKTDSGFVKIDKDLHQRVQQIYLAHPRRHKIKIGIYHNSVVYWDLANAEMLFRIVGKYNIEKTK